MKSKRAIALFAIIATVAISTISLADISAVPLMVSSVPQTHEATGILGHVEYTLMDSNDQIKGYFQGDNAVVDAGKDCVSAYMFEASPSTGLCQGGLTSMFEYVAIGNVTGSIPAQYYAGEQLNQNGGSDCALGASDEGELARKQAATTLKTAATAGGTTGAIIELDTVASPFQFTTANASGVQTIHQSGIFNADYATPNADRTCTGDVQMGAADGDWNMFAIQDLNGATGISVTPGDSLSVKWTLEVG